jgi:hypothetical protein
VTQKIINIEITIMMACLYLWMNLNIGDLPRQESSRYLLDTLTITYKIQAGEIEGDQLLFPKYCRHLTETRSNFTIIDFTVYITLTAWSVIGDLTKIPMVSS